MIFLKRLVILLLTLASVTSFAADDKSVLDKIKSKGVLRVGIEPGFLPFEMRTPQGEWIGFDIDMMEAYAKSLGVKAEFVSTKWEGIIPGLMAGKYDLIVSGMTINPERAKIVLFSEPYYEAGLKILLPKSHAKDVKTWQDLDQPGKIIVLKLGTTGDIYATKTFKKAELRRMDSEADAAQSVLLGKADAFVYDRPFIDIFSMTRSDKVFSLSDLVSKENLGVAGQKKNQALIDNFNVFLAAWRKSGEYDKAYKADFVDLTWKKKFPESMK
ncbi:MAG: transporter substrate-binding domain-containing protein [Chitinophagaceae bacterium]|nr:transporter substrate-binding domain-containing protein [Oligoflexus sp.]